MRTSERVPRQRELYGGMERSGNAKWYILLHFAGGSIPENRKDPAPEITNTRAGLIFFLVIQLVHKAYE